MLQNENVRTGGMTVNSVQGADMIMQGLAGKQARGHELNQPERLQAISIAAMNQRESFGPGPESMTVSQPDLPESTKGALADYAG